MTHELSIADKVLDYLEEHGKASRTEMLHLAEGKAESSVSSALSYLKKCRKVQNHLGWWRLDDGSYDNEPAPPARYVIPNPSKAVEQGNNFIVPSRARVDVLGKLAALIREELEGIVLSRADPVRISLELAVIHLERAVAGVQSKGN